MNQELLIDEDLYRVLDILAQVKELNKMIELHRTQSKDAFMALQYADMKARFLEELQGILDTYELEIKEKEAAA